jgi:cytochrome c oxidase assembly protein subunit 15
MNPTCNPGLHRFAVATACCTLLLLVAGGLVTSNDAGLSVPDWPLSYGSLMPPLVGGIFYEHGHRIIATFVGLLTIILAAWLARTDERRWMRRLGWGALAMVIAQGVLGGLTVKFLLPRPISIAHASLAQLFFCATVTIALCTSRWWKVGSAQAPPVPDAGTPRLRTLAALLFLATFLQLVLGAAFRHKALSVIPHVAWAFVVAFLAAWTVITIRWSFESAQALRRAAGLLGSLLVVQLLLGGGAYWSRLVAAEFPQPIPVMVFFTVAHLAVGALTLAATVLLLLCALRMTRAQEQTVAVGLPELKESAS